MPAMGGMDAIYNVAPPVTVDFGREICGDLAAAEQREWLVTNGTGGFASATLAGHLTRRYHGLLVAALKPPVGRILVVSKLDETAAYDGRSYPLATNRWQSGVVDPQGYRQIERFRLEGITPVWTYALADARLEKRLWMQDGANTTYVGYTLLEASRPLQLGVKALVNYRDFHGSTHAGDWRMRVEPVKAGLQVTAFDGAIPVRLLSDRATAQTAHDWCRNYDLAAERERGLDDHEDHLHAGDFSVTLSAGDAVCFVVSTEPAPSLDARAAYAQHVAREHEVLGHWCAAHPEAGMAAPDWVRQLVLAADQFIVRCPRVSDANARTVIAGYPWFGDWGRDTMIALPGLTLATGRHDVARSILRTFARFTDQGMLPNFFPDAGQQPEYNTVDATLWYFQAIRSYYTQTKDAELLHELYPLLAEIVDWHVRGTRHGIKVDAQDGLLAAGAPGVQLTWMDAKVGEHVITPRIGKPVEVNALWYSALMVMAQFARGLGKPAGGYESMAKRARGGFQRFWNEAAGCCFDVLDGPEGNEATLRPNQIFAVSLPESALSAERQQAIVDTCARQLLTSFGLRSLAVNDPRYVGRYAGGPAERDGAYHQGTVWGWLLGPFALAHLRVYGDAERAASLLEPMSHHLQTAGLGTASEIFDGDAPFTPRGCTAQAWTVGEVLRAWTAIAAARGAGERRGAARVPAPEPSVPDKKSARRAAQR